MTCPCGKGESLETCCGPFISGAALPDSAEALMRSRYTAYATGNIDYTADGSAVNSHPESQTRMVLKRLANLHRTLRWRFRTGVKNQRHAVASGDLDQTIGGPGFSKLLR